MYIVGKKEIFVSGTGILGTNFWTSNFKISRAKTSIYNNKKHIIFQILFDKLSNSQVKSFKHFWDSVTFFWEEKKLETKCQGAKNCDGVFAIFPIFCRFHFSPVLKTHDGALKNPLGNCPYWLHRIPIHILTLKQLSTHQQAGKGRNGQNPSRILSMLDSVAPISFLRLAPC